MLKRIMGQKDQLTIRLDAIHLRLIDDLQPFYGNSRPEVVRAIVIDWLKSQLGNEALRKKRAIR